MSSPQIAIVGFLLDDEEFENLETNRGINISQTQNFSASLARSLQSAGVTLLVESFLPVPDWPRYRQVYIKGKKLSIAGAEGNSRGFINLPVIKHISRLVSLVASSTKEINRAGISHVIIYSVNSSLLMYGRFIQYWHEKTCIVVFTDPPGVILPNDGFMRRALKNIDAFIVRGLLRGFSGQIVVSHLAGIEYFPRSDSLVINGFADDRIPIANQSVSKTIDQQPIRLIYAGSLDPLSGILNLVKAMSELNSSTVVLDIYGAGGDSPKVTELSKTMDNVNFLGKLDHAQILDMYSSYDAIVVPRVPDVEQSKYVFPSKIHEAMMTGIPVICTQLESIPLDYFRFLMNCSTGSPEEIKNAIKRLTSNQKHYVDAAKDGRQYLLAEKTPKVLGMKIANYVFSRNL
jgi:glycosyltransferase involved in cell wall biosynthesis